MTTFKETVGSMLSGNEISVSKEAYMISHPATSNSGLTFGQAQWDLPQNAEININKTRTAQSLLRDILTQATYPKVGESEPELIFPDDKEVEGIMDEVEKRDADISAFEDRINKALSSEYGQKQINNAYNDYLDLKIKRLDDLIQEVRDYGREQVADAIEDSSLLKLLLLDFDNQIGISGIDGNQNDPANAKLLQYLKTGETQLLGKKITMEGDFDLSDYLRFYLDTKQAHTEEKNYDGMKDLSRRLSNVIEALGLDNIELTQEELKFLTEELPKMLGDKYNDIIHNPDNIGLKGILNRAKETLEPDKYPSGSNPIPIGDTPLPAALDPVWAPLKMPFPTGLDPVLDPIRQPFSFPPVSPLVLDLDGDGVETINVKAGAYFDHDGNGFIERTGWVYPDDGILVWDRNNNDTIDDGRELFGNETILMNGMRASNGFQALAEYDSNNDHKITQQDQDVWNNLKVWHDVDGNGFSTADEFLTLEDLDIASINIDYTEDTFVDSYGNDHRQISTFTKTDNTTMAIEDVWFKTEQAFSLPKELLPVSPEIKALPDLRGYGNLYDLRQAMTRDTTGNLKSLVEAFITSTDLLTRNSLMTQILESWSGTGNVSRTSRGPNIDGRELAILEKFVGQVFTQDAGQTNPGPNAAAQLNRSYIMMFELNYAQLMAQSHLMDFYGKIAYSWNEEAQAVRGDMSAVATDLLHMIGNNPTAGKKLLSEFVRTVRGFQAEEEVNFVDFRFAFAYQGEELIRIVDTAGKPFALGTVGDDSLTGTEINDAFDGLGGNDTIKGGDGDDTLYGGDGNDKLYGVNGDDVLDGGAGNDYMIGSAGSDIYRFGRGSGSDTVYDWDGTGGDTDILEFGSRITKDDIELFKENINLRINIKGTTDTVLIQGWFASAGYKIDQFRFEDGTILTSSDLMDIGVTLLGTAGDDAYLIGTSGKDFLYGQEGDDSIAGQSGDDTLDGGAGADTMSGSWGDDRYIVDNIGDVVKEFSNSGTDIVESSITYTLGSNVENLTLTGTSAIDGYGNSLDNVLNGNGAANTLSGGAGNDSLNGKGGADTMAGGAGDDTYVVDNAGDLVTEKAAEGTDTVRTWLNYTLEANVENLTLIGSSNASGTGNELNNVLTGNSGNNTLIGEVGNDTLKGGVGNDTYVFSVGDGTDTIIENDATAGNSDIIQYNVNPVDLIFRRSGNNLEIAIENTMDQATVQNWYSGSANQVEEIHAADGRVLLNTQVGQLIQEMAGFCSQNGLTWEQAIQQKPADVATIISHYWTPQAA